jgi:hypothetical protein
MHLPEPMGCCISPACGARVLVLSWNLVALLAITYLSMWKGGHFILLQNLMLQDDWHASHPEACQPLVQLQSLL